MKSDRPKILHEICGRPMLSYVLNACRLAGADRLIVVVGHGKEDVIRRFEAEADIHWVEQSQQRGTGDAVLCCRDALQGFTGSVLVVAGDMPLVRRATLAGLAESRENTGDAVTLATMVLDDPSGYGRIIRDAEGRLEAIVEDRDCSPEQREIREVNPSYYCFDTKRLFEALEQVRPSAKKDEYYLTDAVRVLREAGHGVSVSVTVAPEDAMGINSRLDLATVSRAMQDRIQVGLMDEGVTIVDPDNTWIESDVAIGRETILYPFTMIGVGAIIGQGCRIGPFAQVGAGEVVEDGSVVGPTACGGVAAL
ncbi:MAG: NTP transferase domain-containing protein [Phycisphaerales bacterium]|nr:MAG: NTP transferase domain-containing protein [Phycisphaerales bacterium]